MRNFKIKKGNLIKLALEGEFDVIVHGANCFCSMGAGLAPQMARVFGADKFPLELRYTKTKYGQKSLTNNVGDINKMGQIDFKSFLVSEKETYEVTNEDLVVVNAYTQYEAGRNTIYKDRPPVNYEAMRLAFMKMGFIFKGKRIGIPEIGCGLAGGDVEVLKQMISEEFNGCDVTLVEFDGQVVYDFPFIVKEKI